MTDLTNLRIFVCTTPITMNLSFDRLMGLAQETFDQDPLSGHLFLFFNRQRDRIKILFWDADGFCIWYKRLEVGVFQLPVSPEGEHGVELTCSQLNRLLGGLDLKNGRRRRRYRRPLPRDAATSEHHSYSFASGAFLDSQQSVK